jgi:hypothetical protein
MAEQQEEKTRRRRAASGKGTEKITLDGKRDS